MKKKLFKYIKIFVSLALILSLIAPSYAALSASDGSAFVTKAEFDSALADFNSRLTTFEAGINSKIDSQVTSYLDRNGIWNGKVQDVYEDPSTTYGLKALGTKKANVFLCMTGTSGSSGWSVIDNNDIYGLALDANGVESDWNKNCSRSMNGIWIQNTNKSGLLFAQLFDSYDVNNQLRVRVGTLGTNLADDVFNGIYSFSLDFKIAGERKWGTGVSWSVQAAGTVLRCPQVGSATIMFFVSSGDTVVWEESESYTKFTGSIGNWTTTLFCYADKNSRQTRKIVISAPYIY